MDYKEVKLLLDKFYNSHTTCLEEQDLYEWLCSDRCPEELFIDRDVLRTHIQQHSSVNIPDELELKMESLIDSWAYSEHPPTPIHKRIHLQWKYITGIAAMIALVTGMGIYLHSPQKGVYIDTCQTPEEAYMEAKKALSLISETMQKGIEPITND